MIEINTPTYFAAQKILRMKTDDYQRPKDRTSVKFPPALKDRLDDSSLAVLEWFSKSPNQRIGEALSERRERSSQAIQRIHAASQKV
jgi:hypothetical protein